MLVRQGGGSETLMHEVEPHLVELICVMAQIWRYLTTSESIALANDLIAGTQLEKVIIEWKKQRMEYDPTSPVIGKKVLDSIQKEMVSQVSFKERPEIRIG